jgi:predicted MPP superfamily phosphohydrolase
MVKINGNVTVVGDIHGQFPDFMKCLNIINAHYTELYNFLKKDYLLFLGDYVDRGIESIEVMTFIMALKINNPKTVICLRGNH